MKRVKNYLFICLLLSIAMSAHAQVNITHTEYFFDTDPGLGNGTPVSITAGQNIQNHVFNANVTSITNGMHTLYVRSKDANGRWSLSTSMVFAKVQTPFTNNYSAANIDKAEYFYDTDPGFGNGTNIPLTASANITNLVFSANMSSISAGVHTLYVRSRDANGKWSLASSHVFAKSILPYGNPYTAGNIVKAEYFYDTDPGFGNGTDIPLTAGTNISNLVFNANVASISNGVHVMYIRTKDAQGKWSIANAFNFAKVQAPFSNPNTLANIVKMEYFFNTDPGAGNGTNVPVTPGNNINGMIVNIPIGSLSNSLHTLYIRTQDANGKWSLTGNLSFSKIQSPSTSTYTKTKIVKAEYFFDSDPGFGNGINIPLTPSLDISNMVFSASISALNYGIHNLYVRTKDSLGQWSMSNVVSFAKVQSPFSNPYTAGNINKAEYFFDTDPGFGSGTDIPVTANSNIAGLTVNVNVAPLSNGIHTLYIRTRDASGRWSVTNTTGFAKVQLPMPNPHSAGNIIKLEYFYDSDPGFGNGTDVPVTASTNISSIMFNANVASLSNGVHTLYLRSKDAQGKWSITPAATFAKIQAPYTNPHVKSNITRLEYFVDTDPGIGNAFPIAFTQDTNVTNVAFNVDMTVLVNGAHKLYIRSKDAFGKWSITNVHAFSGGTAPLAIKLLSFEAKIQSDKTVMLEWITEQEKDVARYVVERSYDASNWKYLGEKLPVTSTSNEKRTYQLSDKDPGTGIIYYRLTETDNNGNKTQTPIRFVKIENNENPVASLYPNPNDGKRINISSLIFSEGEVSISIIAADGKIHLSQTVNEPKATTFTLSDLHLAAGNYFVNLQSKNKTESLKLQVTGSQF